MFFEFRAVTGHFFTPTAPSNINEKRADIYCDAGGDASGIKQRVDQWQLFYDEIENYQHQAGVRNVLRLKRYTRQQAPADASRYVYVLDMVVESENTSISGGRR